MSELVYYRDLDEQLLVFPILGVEVGIELKYVKSISLTSDLIPIPRSPKYILGIVNIDSNIYPILDLDVLLSGKKKDDISQTIVSLIDIKDTVFGIHTQNLPHVVPGTVGDTKGSVDRLPKEWVLGYTEHGELGTIPIINPKKFWIDLGESEVTGPVLDTEMTAADLYPDGDEMSDVEDTIDQISAKDEIVQESQVEESPEEELVEMPKMTDDMTSDIFQLESIGQKVKEELISAGFDTIEKLATASLDDLTAVSGVGKKTAENISAIAKEFLGSGE